MTPLLVTTAIAVVAGAVVAVSARDVRLVLIGLAASLLVAPLVADPLPDGAPLVARAAGSLLALEILYLAIRDRGAALRGSLLGWPAKACAAAAAAIAGYAVANGVAPDAALLREVGSAGAAPVPMARAAGFAVLVLAAGSVVGGRDALRMSLGGLLLLTGGELVRIGVVGPPTGLEQLVVAGVMIALAVAFASAVARAVSPLAAGSEGVTAELWPDAVPAMAGQRARMPDSSVGRSPAPRPGTRSPREVEGGVGRVRRPRAERDRAQLTLLDEPVPHGSPSDRPATDGRLHDRPPTDGTHRPPTDGTHRPRTDGTHRPPTDGALADSALPDHALLDGPGSVP